MIANQRAKIFRKKFIVVAIKVMQACKLQQEQEDWINTHRSTVHMYVSVFVLQTNVAHGQTSYVLCSFLCALCTGCFCSQCKIENTLSSQWEMSRKWIRTFWKRFGVFVEFMNRCSPENECYFIVNGCAMHHCYYCMMRMMMMDIWKRQQWRWDNRSSGVDAVLIIHWTRMELSWLHQNKTKQNEPYRNVTK